MRNFSKNGQISTLFPTDLFLMQKGINCFSNRRGLTPVDLYRATICSAFCIHHFNFKWGCFNLTKGFFGSLVYQLTKKYKVNRIK